MQIACPNCTTSYEIAASALGEVGRMVRCVQCHEQWFATALAYETADAASSSAHEAAAFGHAPAGDDNSWDIRDRSGQQPAQEDWTHTSAQWSADPRMEEEVRPARLPAEEEIAFVEPAEDLVAVQSPATAPYGHDGGFAAAGEGASQDADPNAEPDYFEIRRQRQARARKKKQPGPWVTLPRAIAVMAALIAGLVLMRADVVRLLPQTASLYGALGFNINLRGLVFENVKSVMDVQDGVPVLMIEGTIRNVTRETREVPRLRFSMRNGAGADIYSWTAVAERTQLKVNESFAFRSRLASPPAESKGVFERFVPRRDFVTASH
jgi:predicted Zn finger-like uncharacterized protein